MTIPSNRFGPRGPLRLAAAASTALLFAACKGTPDLTFEMTDATAEDASAPPLDGSLGSDAGQVDADVDASDAFAGDAELLPCGDAGPCTFATSTCCLTKLGFECIIRGTACGGVNLQCRDGDECNGNKVCCGVVNDGGVRRFTCVAAPACSNANGSPACDPDASTPCPNGMNCTPTAIDGYAICT